MDDCACGGGGCGGQGEESGLLWTEEAEKRLESVPVFVRAMAKSGIEKFAKDKGVKEVTPEVMNEARESMGM